VSWRRSGVGLLGAVLLSAALAAQRPALPGGLKAGPYDVGTRPVGAATVWYPAWCDRRPAQPLQPCRNALPDSGRFPILLLAGEDPATDSARLAYFASHGYVVTRVAADAFTGPEFRTLWGRIKALPFADSSRSGGIGAAVPAAAVQAIVARDGDASSGRSIPSLTWRAPGSPTAARGMNEVVVVEVASTDGDQLRFETAVARSFFVAALPPDPAALQAFARRLRRAGVTVACGARVC